MGSCSSSNWTLKLCQYQHYESCKYLHRSHVQGINCELLGFHLHLQVPLTPCSGCDLAGKKIFIAGGKKMLLLGFCFCVLSTWNCVLRLGCKIHAKWPWLWLLWEPRHWISRRRNVAVLIPLVPLCYHLIISLWNSGHKTKIFVQFMFPCSCWSHWMY